MDKSIYGRKDRLIKEKRHDAYQKEDKWPEGTICIQCGALFVNGRWTWQKASKEVNKIVCPACKRIIDNYPAGYIDIKGKFFAEHSDEITNLILNIEKQETNQHPLERVISIAGTKSHTQVTTTGIHIARRIGEALSSAYKGELLVQYADAEQSVRVSWQR